MLSYDASTVIGAPIDQVWRIICDVGQMPQWTTTMRSVQILGGSALGRSSRVRIKQPWLPTSVWTVDLFDPPRYFSWRSRTGSIETVAGHQLEDRGPVTAVTFSIRHSGRGAAVVGPVIMQLSRRYVDRELSALKSRLERRQT